MEWDQPSWERSFLDMSFLDDEDLPFLRQFDNAPKVSLGEVLEILQPTPTSTIENTREHYHAASHTGPGGTLYTTLSATPGQPIMNDHSSTYSFNAAPAEEALQSSYAYAAHSQYAVNDHYAAKNNYAANNQGESIINNHSSIRSPSATPVEGASSDATKAQTTNGRPQRMKRACKTCTKRKIKCKLIAASEPLVCDFCSQKGLVCEFEERKVYTRSGA